ncbi:MAG: (S)-benzoin forming benzil reductase [Bacteroidia bacterium]|nr:(S)-benzoin forming benzil reductase [Bacteroidia bacterium]
MKKDHYIITGTSRGIGEAIALKLLVPENKVICISRNENPKLALKALTTKGDLKDIAFDLDNVERIPELMHRVLRRIDPEEVKSLTLINNAGVIHPIMPIGETQLFERIIRNVNVNLISPMLIIEYFIKNTRDWDVERKILNLNTGAASRPVNGWSAYCSSKAGLAMFARCLAEEQADSETPVKVVSFSPGVVDTEMQMEIRESDNHSFKEVEKFRQYKKQGQLKNPIMVADSIIEMIQSPDFGNVLEYRMD